MGWIILAIVVILVIAIISMYNGLVSSRVKVDNAWSQIDVQLQRRFDLIPNFAEKAVLDNQLSGALKTIMAVSENYPDLKANQNFSELSEELRNTENKISFSRQFYNDTVTMYNQKLQIFPSNIIANMFNFTPRELFTVDNAEARKNVKVDFGKKD